MEIIVSATKAANGIIAHEYGEGEQAKRKEYSDVRGAISWPALSEDVLGYYCIFGEEYVKSFEGREQRGKLCLLSEFAAPDIRMTLDTFFSRIVDDVKRYLCTTLYAVQESRGEDRDGYATAFQKFANARKVSCNVEQPPYADTPDLGMHYIKSWAKRGLLSLPQGSIVRDQVRAFESENIKQALLTFSAVNALRFVVCGFEDDKPVLSSKNWRGKIRQGSWRT